MTSRNQAERTARRLNDTALSWRRHKTNKTHLKGKRGYKRFMARARRILDKAVARDEQE